MVVPAWRRLRKKDCPDDDGEDYRYEQRSEQWRLNAVVEQHFSHAAHSKEYCDAC
jgi:hypothetical protein